MMYKDEERAALAERANRQLLHDAEERQKTSVFKARMFTLVVGVSLFVAFIVTRV